MVPAHPIVITRVHALPDGIHALAQLATAEGHNNVATLINEFVAGSNRFRGRGEALFAAYAHPDTRPDSGDELIAVGGLNRDPYTPTVRAARVRRLFVVPDYRRAGTATGLMNRIEAFAARHFQKIQLFTASAQASAFYVSLGYRPVTGHAKVSHEKQLTPLQPVAPVDYRGE